jgi:hypothetical protein
MSASDPVIVAASAFLDDLMPVLKRRCPGDSEPLELRGFTQWILDSDLGVGMRRYRAATMSLTAEQQCAVQVLNGLRETGFESLTRLEEALAADPAIGPRIRASSVTSFGAGGGAMQALPWIQLLVDHAVSEASGFDLEPTARDELVARWAESFRRPSDRITLVLVLYEFDAPETPIVVEANLEIDELREDEIAAALSFGGGLRGLEVDERMVSKTFGIRRSFETQLFVDQIPEAEADKEQRIREEAEDRAQLLLQALRLFKAGRVTASGSFQYVTSPLTGVRPVMGGVGPMFGWHWGQPYVLTPEETPAFLEFWAKFDKARTTTVIASALRRFRFAADRASPEDEIVDLMIAAESLFLSETSKRDRGEMRYRLATRAGALVGTSVEDRLRIWKFMRDAYDARSVIVHGGTPDEKDLLGLDRQPLRLDLFADELDDVMRRALQRAITMVAYGQGFPPAWEELIFAGPPRPQIDDRGRVVGARESKIDRLRHRLGVGPRMPRRIHTTSRWRRLVAHLFG